VTYIKFNFSVGNSVT